MAYFKGFGFKDCGMKTLLLGKDGQLGWQLQRSLAPLGELLACGRAECDVLDSAQLRSLIREFRPDVIVNATAYTAVDKAEAESSLAYAVNAEAPGVMAAEAASLGAQLIHYSTDYVFDGAKSSPYVETDPTSPQSVYGRSKLAGEQAIMAANCRSLIFRTSWVFGEHGGNFVKTILRLAREREGLNVVSDQVGSPTPAALISSVTALVLHRMAHDRGQVPEGGRIYHLAAAGAVSWCDFAQEIVAQAAQLPGSSLRMTPDAVRPIASADYPTAARRPANSRLDCARLEADFGLKMPPWQPYLARMLALLA